MKKLILIATLFPILFLALGAAGAVTYTGKFVGDGSGLTNLPASGGGVTNAFHALTYYVSPSGSDLPQNGSSNAPFATLSYACQIATNYGSGIWLMPGVNTNDLNTSRTNNPEGLPGCTNIRPAPGVGIFGMPGNYYYMTNSSPYQSSFAQFVPNANGVYKDLNLNFSSSVQNGIIMFGVFHYDICWPTNWTLENCIIHSTADCVHFEGIEQIKPYPVPAVTNFGMNLSGVVRNCQLYGNMACVDMKNGVIGASNVSSVLYDTCTISAANTTSLPVTNGKPVGAVRFGGDNTYSSFNNCNIYVTDAGTTNPASAIYSENITDSGTNKLAQFTHCTVYSSFTNSLSKDIICGTAYLSGTPGSNICYIDFTTIKSDGSAFTEGNTNGASILINVTNNLPQQFVFSNPSNTFTGAFTGNASGANNINYNNIANPPAIPTTGNLVSTNDTRSVLITNQNNQFAGSFTAGILSGYTNSAPNVYTNFAGIGTGGSATVYATNSTPSTLSFVVRLVYGSGSIGVNGADACGVNFGRTYNKPPNVQTSICYGPGSTPPTTYVAFICTDLSSITTSNFSISDYSGTAPSIGAVFYLNVIVTGGQ